MFKIPRFWFVKVISMESFDYQIFGFWIWACWGSRLCGLSGRLHTGLSREGAGHVSSEEERPV